MFVTTTYMDVFFLNIILHHNKAGEKVVKSVKGKS